jgi:hypothetical protein
MTIGDLVRRRDLTWDLALVRAHTQIDDADPYDIVNERLFQVPLQTSRPSLKLRLWRSAPLGRPSRAPRPTRTEKLSLFQFLDQRHNTVTYGTPSGGRETVAVPFTHVAVLTSASGRPGAGLPAELCREIEEQIEARFGQSIDPLASVRVGSAASGTLDAGQMIAYIGEGVFVPLDGEKPTGCIRIGPSLDSLEEPVIFGDRPAGIYRGQPALAFGSSHLVTPATARLGLPDDVWFYLEAAHANAPTQSVAKMIDVNPRGVQAIKLVEATDTADVRFCFEFAHADPASGYSNTLYVDVTVDERPSRLLHERPGDRPAFEIAGFRITAQDLSDGVDAFWFDFDARGHPISSAITPREVTIVYDGRRTRRYSWRRYDYEPQAVAEYQVASERGGFTLRRNDGQALGFLAAPVSPVPAVFQADWWATRGYHLDWLDFTGCVENALGNEGLAEIHAGRGGILVPSFATAPDGEFEIGPLILRRPGRHAP